MTTTTELQVPVVDDERIEETYKELKSMQVVLDSNPIEHGPRRFNNRIAQVRSMLNRVEQLFLQASEDLHYFKRIINAKRGIYDLDKRELMVKDPSCRVGRSQGEREAIADVRLRPQIEEILQLEAAALDLETLMLSIRSKRTDLKDAQNRMRDQMKLIEHDISMGARWGTRDVPMGAVAQGASDLDDMLEGVDTALGIVDDQATELVVGLGTEEEEEEEESLPAPVEVIPAVAKPQGKKKQELAPIEILLPSSSDEEPDMLESALSGKASVPQFGDGVLTRMSDVESFFAGVDNLDATPTSLRVSPTDGIDDLIASLADD